jgi:hypothetical protein
MREKLKRNEVKKILTYVRNTVKSLPTLQRTSLHAGWRLAGFGRNPAQPC